MRLQLDSSFDVIQEVLHIDGCVPKRSFEGKAIHLVMEREYNPAAIEMFHLHMATLAVNLHESHSL